MMMYLFSFVKGTEMLCTNIQIYIVDSTISTFYKEQEID